MKINKIKQLKDGRYKIKLEDEEITTYDDVLINNGILYKKELDEELINKIKIDNEYYAAYNKTLKYITRRIRSKKEIEEYIEQFELSDSDNNKLINKLIDIGLINDTHYCHAYISDSIYLSNDGPYKIKDYLVGQNIDINIIEEELDKIDKDIIYDKAYKIISKKVKNNKYSIYQLKQKIVIDLVNLGYDRDLVNEILDTFDYNENDNLDKEYNKLYTKLSKKYSDYELIKKIKEKLYAKGYDINTINSYLNKKEK